MKRVICNAIACYHGWPLGPISSVGETAMKARAWARINAASRYDLPSAHIRLIAYSYHTIVKMER